MVGGIANRVIAETLRLDGVLVLATPLDTLPESVVAEPVDGPSSAKVAILSAIVESLSDREKDVLLEWLFYYKYGQPHQRLPNAASAALAARWQTTPENIRAIRSRTLKKIREEFERRSGGHYD